MGIYNLYLIDSEESVRFLYENKDSIYNSIISLKNDDGSFRME